MPASSVVTVQPSRVVDSRGATVLGLGVSAADGVSTDGATEGGATDGVADDGIGRGDRRLR